MTKSLLNFLVTIEDPRLDRTKKHGLLDIMVIAICAVICGAQTWTEIEDFGDSKKDWFSKFLELKNGIPSHDTFRRVFQILNPEEFTKVFYNWVSCVNKNLLQNDHICIDGKSLRGAVDKARSECSVHVVNAFSTNAGLCLGMLKSSGKKNEIKTIPEVLKILNIKGSLVSIDAMGCQLEIAKKIIDQEGDYLLALKSNHKYLEKRVKKIFEDSKKGGKRNYVLDRYEETNKGHGRQEKRICRVIRGKEDKHLGINILGKWPQLESVVEVISKRKVKVTGKSSIESRYFICSTKDSAETLLKKVRSHWQIENKLHWSLDVSLREDECQTKDEVGAVNFSILRHIALNLIKTEAEKKSVRRKQKMAGWDESYLLKILLNNGLSMVI